MTQTNQLASVKTESPKAIARKHGVELDVILRQLEMGIKVEQEHTKNPQVAREIALDHLLELPDYYSRLRKMEESDIQDILHRSGIQVEADESRRKLDKFENMIVDIALRLIDEKDEMDPATAGMDILDAINANIMTESIRRNAGTWYDPMKRALDILENELPEDILASVRDRLEKYSDDYIRSKSDEDEEDEEECDAEETSISEMAEELAYTDFHLDRVGRKSMNNVVDMLQMMEESAGRPIEMRFKTWTGDEFDIRKRAGLTEACDCELMDSYGDSLRGHGMDMSTFPAAEIPMGDTLSQIIPELNAIAMHYVEDRASKQRLREIANQLKAMKRSVDSQKRA